MSLAERLRTRVGSLVALAAACACTERSQQRVARPERAALALGASLGPAFTSPARLRYHPRERARALAERALGDDRRLIVGEGGERWIFDPKQRSLQAGAALAPEGLIGMLEGQGEYWFVGSSGTTYAASSWLGPFERSSVPAEPLVSVSTAGTTIIGVAPGRTLLRSSDFGATWTSVGPRGVEFVDVALSPSGVGLALAIPEAVYETSDYGATFARSALPPTGVLELETSPKGALIAETVFGERTPGKGGWTPVSAVDARARELPQPPRGPDAGALSEGRAVIDRTRYFELASGRTGGSWVLWQGKLDGALGSRPFPEAKGCSDVRLHGFDRYLMFACFRARNEAGAQPIELFFSASGGQQFTKLQGRLDGILGVFRLAVGAGGNFVMSGVCAPAAQGAGCNPGGVQHGNGLEPPPKEVEGKAAASIGALSATPSLAETAQALAFSYDGTRAYAVGRRTKTGRYALFVSRDAGHSFEPEDLELLPLAMDDDDANVDRTPSARVEGLSPAEDGAVAITFVTYGRRMLVVTDEQGKLLSSAEPPEARSLIAASGLRAISVSPATRQLWESVDGGVTFQPVSRLPVEVCPNDSTCELPVRCAPEGCVVGQKLTRVGWGGQSSDQASLLPPPLRAAPPSSSQRKVRTPFACTVETQPWRVIPGVTDPPRVDDSAIGNVDWYALADDPDRAAVTLHVAERGRVLPLVLLAPSDRPTEKAFAVLEQIEGIAALRYRIPESSPGQVNLTDVEVAWTNFLEGNRVNLARLKDGGPFVPGDYASGAARAQQAAPDLVSVASKGLYLRIHQSARTDQPTLFLDGRRVVTLPPVTFPRGSKLSSQFEVAHVGDAHVPLRILGRGTAIQRAHLTGGRYTFDAMTVGLSNPADFGLTQVKSIGYAGERSGLYLATFDEAGTLSGAALHPFQAEGDAVGPAIPLPTLLSLGDKPAACTPERRARTPRSVAVATPGTRHPVLVSDSIDGPRTLLTTDAVLYGTPELPCASSFGASFVSPDGSPPARESALVLLDAPERSVLFRVIGDREATRVEYRTMSCRLDPTAEVPGEVYRALSASR